MAKQRREYPLSLVEGLAIDDPNGKYTTYFIRDVSFSDELRCHSLEEVSAIIPKLVEFLGPPGADEDGLRGHWCYDASMQEYTVTHFEFKEGKLVDRFADLKGTKGYGKTVHKCYHIALHFFNDADAVKLATVIKDW